MGILLPGGQQPHCSRIWKRRVRLCLFELQLFPEWLGRGDHAELCPVLQRPKRRRVWDLLQRRHRRDVYRRIGDFWCPDVYRNHGLADVVTGVFHLGFFRGGCGFLCLPAAQHHRASHDPGTLNVTDSRRRAVGSGRAAPESAPAAALGLRRTPGRISHPVSGTPPVPRRLASARAAVAQSKA